MKNKVLILGSHGLGDSIQSLQCAHFAKMLNKDVTVISCTRNEVFDPLYFLFGDLFDLLQHPLKEDWGHDNWILKNQESLKSLSYFDEIYYSIPDLLFKHPLAFNYQKYNTNPQVIKQTRLLTHKFRPEKRIYIGLATSTDGYLYSNIPALLRKLGNEIPDHEIYFTNVKNWAGRELNYGDLSNMPPNVIIHDNPKFYESLAILGKSCLGLYTCNGPSHLGFQFGQNRIILDPQYKKTLWEARWREDFSECIDINTSINDVVSLVKENINTPQTLLLPRQKVLDILIKNNYSVDWKSELLFKF